jgi:protocatechuate 3,4-dioxygenase beta subunit
MMIQAEGFAKLVTALYMAGDEYLSSDAVFGAKKSLTCEVKANYDDDEARAKGFPRGPFWYTEYDFVLQTNEEAEKERRTSLPNFYKFVDTLNEQ